MKKLLLPIILMIVGTGAGAGAGFFLKPAPVEEEEMAKDEDPVIHCEPGDTHVDADTPPEDDAEPVDPEAERAYAKLNNQFVVPLLTDEVISGLMALSLTIEVLEGDQEQVYSAEPKLRDAFLQVMFDHANTGGFAGNFTTGTNMANLRKELVRAARAVVGPIIVDVLILDIVRQDI